MMVNQVIIDLEIMIKVMVEAVVIDQVIMNLEIIVEVMIKVVVVNQKIDLIFFSFN